MDQQPLFIETYHEALTITVQALGGNKRVGMTLKPELGAEHAARWMSDCCNPDRQHELHINQLALIRRMARDAGVHTLAAYEMREAGYEPPVMADEEKVVEDLQRGITRMLADVQAQLGRIERIKTGGRR